MVEATQKTQEASHKTRREIDEKKRKIQLFSVLGGEK
jgi:hypothetical protein